MGALLGILAAVPSALDRIDGMGSLTRALEVETPLLLLLTSSSCADCRFLAMGFGEAASLAPRARFTFGPMVRHAESNGNNRVPGFVRVVRPAVRRVDVFAGK